MSHPIDCRCLALCVPLRQLAGRCAECGMHARLQNHRPECTRKGMTCG